MLSRLFRPLRHPGYRWYFYGQMVSIAGTWMQATAAAWFVYQATGLTSWTAAVTVAEFLPGTMLGWLGGRLADRYPRRHVLYLTQIGMLATALGLGVLAHLDLLTPARLLGLVFGAGVLNAIDGPTRIAYVKNLAGDEDLPQAIGLAAFLVNFGRAAGPALAGVVLTMTGAEGCFFANAATFAFVLFSLTRISDPGLPAPRPRAERPTQQRSAVRRYPGLGVLMGVAGLVSFCGWPFLSLLPALAHRMDPGQADLYSTFVSAAGVGAMLAVFLNARVDQPSERRKMTLVGIASLGVGLLGLSLAPHPLVAVLACVACGLGIVLFQSTAQATVQLAVSDAEQGQVGGTLFSVLGLGVLLGTSSLGPAADHVGVAAVLGGQVALTVLAALGQAYVLTRHARLFERGGSPDS